MIPTQGQRVRVSRDLKAERSPRVPPTVGHLGTVDAVHAASGTALVVMDLYGRKAWYAFEELEQA